MYSQLPHEICVVLEHAQDHVLCTYVCTLLLGAHQLVDIWKRNARIEPYEGTTRQLALTIIYYYMTCICINYPVYLPYAVFHSEVRCGTKFFCGKLSWLLFLYFRHQGKWMMGQNLQWRY